MRRDVFQAIADPTRRDIINLLINESLTLNGVADNFEISRPAISKHIKILRECGLIIIRHEGRERYCDVQPGPLQEVNLWTEQYKRFWNSKLNSLEKFLAKKPKSKTYKLKK